MSAPTFVAAANSLKIDTTATSMTVNLPAVAAGDLTVLSIVRYGSNTTISTPAGWTLLASTTARAEASGYTQLHVFYKIASAAASATTQTVSGSGLSYWAAKAAVYRGGNPATPVASFAAADGKTTGYATAPAISAAPNATRVSITGYRTDQYWAPAPSGWTRRGDDNAVAHWESATFTAAAQIFNYFNAGSNLNWHAVSIALAGANSAPNAPTLTAPADGSTIDRNSIQRFALTPSDPDPGDSTSKTDWRYRLIGASTWTDVSQALPQTYIDFAAGTFAAGDYEWQARTYDAQGVAGPYSGSGFFTAATAPATPTITAPVSGATVSNAQTVTWSAPAQAAYQLRRVADNAGSPNTAAVYYDTGEVVTATDRSRDVAFETNDRYEHVQVRIKLNGMWSSWASVRVRVSYTPPTTPVVTLTPDATSGSLLIGITNPAPGAGVPATSYNDVYIDDGDGEERKVAMLAPNTAWTYWTPVSGRDYDGKVSVTAVGDNGTTASSTA